MQWCGAARILAVVCLLSAEAAAERANHPPRIQDLVDRVREAADVTRRVRPGQPVEFELAAFDPDGDKLRYEVDGLPEGAKFDAERARFVWTPTLADVGRHLLVFSVSDGEATVMKSAAVVVEQNHAPVAVHRSSEAIPIIVGASDWIPLATEPDADLIKFEVRSAPPGLEFQARGADLQFRPRARPEDVGEHEFTVVASDGELTTTIRQRYVVYDRDDARDWHLYVAPGFGYAGYVPFEGGGAYHGFRAEFTFVARRNARLSSIRCDEVRDSDRCGVSHLRLYAAMEATYPTRDGAGPLGAYSVGFTRSFEIHPDRKYLIPHYALEFGLVSPAASPLLFELVPALGLHVLTSRPFWLDATLGLRLVPTRLQTMLGPHAGLTLTIDAI